MRLVSLIAATTAALVLALPAHAEDKVLNVYNWSDYIDPDAIKKFEQETGIKVTYDTYDSNETLETKLLAGSTGYDLVVPSASFLQRQIKAGVYLPLDKAKIPNLKYKWDAVYSKLSDYDPDNAHAVNYMWGTTGIGYNVDKAKAIMGDKPMNTWDIIFKPEILAKFAECGVYVLDSPEDVVPAALKYIGLDPNSKNPADIEKAGVLLDSIRPSIRKFHSSEYINALVNGDICLAIGYSGDVFLAKSRAVDAHTKSPDKPLVSIDYVIPKEGALMWFDSFAIPKDAPHVEAAYAFIDFMERPEIAAQNSNFVSYANGNLESQKTITPEILKNPSIYPDPETMGRLFTVTAYDTKVQRVLTRVWTKFKTGQ